MSLVRIVVISVVFGALVTYHVLPKQQKEVEGTSSTQEVVDVEETRVVRFEQAVKDTFYSDNN